MDSHCYMPNTRVKSKNIEQCFHPKILECSSLTKSISSDYMTFKATPDAYVNLLTNEVE